MKIEDKFYYIGMTCLIISLVSILFSKFLWPYLTVWLNFAL